MAHRVVAPLMGVNEPDMRVVEVHVRDGDRVEVGDVLCVLETSKAAPNQDLDTPPVEESPPAPGKRVKAILPAYQGTEIYHALYLPTDWEPGRQYPVIIEYSGNKYKSSLGIVDECDLGYGISGGHGFIWVCLPYISPDHQRNQATWWGDLDATAAVQVMSPTVRNRTVSSNGSSPSRGDRKSLTAISNPSRMNT